MGSGNWIVDNLNSALQTWNDKLAEIWTLISTTPEDFRGGGIWNVIVSINGALQAIGYALLVLFFVMGVVKTCGSFTEIKRPEVAFKCFIRFVLAQAAVTYGMELMNALFRVAQGAVSTIMDASGMTAMSPTTLPEELITAIESVGLLESIPLWAVTLLGSLFIWVLSLVMILTVYSPLFQALHGHRHRAYPPGQFRGTALQQHRRRFPQKLCRHLPGGLYHCAGLRHFFRSLPPPRPLWATLPQHRPRWSGTTLAS